MWDRSNTEKMVKRKMKYDEAIDHDSDGNFYFIAGYTSCGFPYGVTWEQSDEDGVLEGSGRLGCMKTKEESDEDDLPF